MRDGASDVVQKLSPREHKADRIHEALEASGRTSHRVCEELSSTYGRVNASNALTLSIPGEQDGRRVVVCLGVRRAKLTHSALRILLHLVKAHLSGSLVHKTDLGSRNEQGFRGVSALRSELSAAYDGDLKKLVTNDQRGSYGLAAHVTIGPVETEQLERIGDHKITKLAREIRRAFTDLQESAGKH
jgi:hypothetical protein